MTAPRSASTLPQEFLNNIVAVESIAAVPTILDVVCRTTGMGFAAVVRVTEERWVACAIKDDIAFGLKPGGELPIETTICHEIRQSSTAVVIDHVAEDPAFCAHHTPARYGFQSYISMPIVLPDGTFFGTLCAIDPKPAKLNTPAIVGMFKMFADLIGFHLDANQRLASRTAERDLYENIIQSDAEPICVFDTEYRLIAFNKAHNDEFFRVNGFYTKIGDVFPDLFIPEQAAAMRANMARALAGEAYTVEAVFGRAEYQQPCWEITYAPLRDVTGRVFGAFHQARDISARLRAEAELQDAQDVLRQSQKLEVIGQLTGGVAHDFNNLLTVIKSSTDLLKRSGLSEERRARYVEAISDTVDRAAKLTGQLLAFARRQALKPKVFAACDSVRALSEVLATLTGSQVRIVTELPEKTCYVNADPNQFDTALVNMAVNARDAMEGAGQVTIRVEAVEQMPPVRTHPAVRGPFVAVSISDTGSGIPKDSLERIFEPFFTTKGVGQGTGLGLSQVFGFAKQSHGEVVVASEVGHGTTFTLYLPRVGGEVQMPDRGEAEPPSSGSGTCVLVVEDNVEVGTFATQTLAELGFATAWAANAQEALAELTTGAGRFDVVFTDVMMPGMNGVDLAREIQRLYPDLPVVLTSGYSHVLAEKGTDGFDLLDKPYSVDQLARTLRNAINRLRR
ncbi:ATP-binding protein [Methylobacterium sp. R2-1]|uniref:GAF domain-containing hybrid sensor histidine kinase/response regulator n=1 Tax=Methylobacterium sp. R2-1 TaxID=2587064 RepID=UPI00161753D1|nr:ATP-binding protein [Methylobacterium sp. R2-1]MBB2960943.1 PAS domain S-box-containing protein [Methylobacterium sp. R2-1]